MSKKVNISIDDISPPPQSSIKVLDRCYELIEAYPKVKFTLFIPMAYTRHNEKSWDIRHDAKFCETLRGLPKTHFELGWHGVNHGIIGKSSNNEFEQLSYEQCVDVLLKMFEIAREANVYDCFNPIMRPSAFRMSAASMQACKVNGIDILALSRSIDYDGADKTFNRVVCFDCNPPHTPLILKNSTEIVYHACEWSRNYLSVINSSELKAFLGKNIKDIEFVFMEGMVGK